MPAQGKSEAPKIARLLWQTGCVSIKAKPSFRWASGLRSPIYTDNRLLLSDPQARSAVAKALLAVIKRRRIACDCVAGVATSGIPLAAILADRLGKPLVYVRPKAKGHGKQQQIEGQLKKGARVILIEDLISTGGSSLAAAKALKKAGARVSHILATFAYLPDLVTTDSGRGNPAPTVIVLTDAATLLNVGRRLKYIGPQQEEAARAFLDKLAKKL